MLGRSRSSRILCEYGGRLMQRSRQDAGRCEHGTCRWRRTHDRIGTEDTHGVHSHRYAAFSSVARQFVDALLLPPRRSSERSAAQITNSSFKTLSAFNPSAQRNAFRRRDVRLQSRSFARVGIILVATLLVGDNLHVTGYVRLHEVVSDYFRYFTRTLNAVKVFWNPGQAGSQEFIYPLIAAVTDPILTFAPPAFFGAYSKNWPLPRSIVRDPSPTLKIVFSPRRVIV